MDIGFIGLGVMGAPMATHLANAGHRLTLLDVNAAAARDLAATVGGTAVTTPAEVAAASDVVITMLPNGEVVQQVALGEQGLIHGLREGAVLLDTSSAEPWLTQQTAAAIAARGATMVDAPVSGAAWGAQAAELVFMVGGSDDDVARVRPLLERMGKAVHHLGRLGAGHAMKCLNNCITAMTFSATAEALVVGKRYGLDPAVMVDVLNQSTGGSWITQTHFHQRIFNRSFDDPFKLELMRKDVGIAVQLAQQTATPMPMAGLGQQLWRMADHAAGPGASVSELVRWVEQLSGTELTPGRGEPQGVSTMDLEDALAGFVVGQPLDAVPPEARRTAQRVLLAVAGTGVAGAGEDGMAELRTLLRERGGTPQATSLVFGDRLPAVTAAQLNGTMCRALDFCDAMAPGPHFGAALVPTCLAAAELRGGCSGAEFLAALVVGCEVGARFNLTERQYDGFDPTGIAAVFAATAGVARVLRLDALQTRRALGLAFNRCGGSFQSHIDGTLGVRLLQGHVAATAVECAQMAQRGLTGPLNFLTGIYGFPHLYGRDTLPPADVVAGLGTEWRLQRMMFKPYPSCGATQGLTQLVLDLVQETGLQPEQVVQVEVRQPPYSHKLVGHPFRLGANPRVDAQFSAAWCVANALVRRSSRLEHFRPAQIAEPVIMALAARVHTVGDPAMDARGHTAVDIVLTTADGTRHARGLDIAPGFPGRPLSDAQHRQRFADCMAYAPLPLPSAHASALLEGIEGLAGLADVRDLLALLVVP